MLSTAPSAPARLRPTPARRRPRPVPRVAALALLVPVLAGLVTVAAPAAPADAAVATRTWIGTSQTVDAGRTAVLTAALGTASGPVAGRRVVVYQKTSSGWRGVAAGTTGRDGRVRVPVRPGATAQYGAAFAGDGAYTRSTTPRPVTVTVRDLRSRIIAEAARHRGKPYRYGAVGPDSFDCSGFTRYVFSRFGIELPHNSRAQYDAARRIPMSEVRPGDLVFTYHGGRIGHVGIYAGNGHQWHSPQSGDVVKYSSLAGREMVAARVL